MRSGGRRCARSGGGGTGRGGPTPDTVGARGCPSAIRQSAGRSAVDLFHDNDTSVADSTARALFAHY